MLFAFVHHHLYMLVYVYVHGYVYMHVAHEAQETSHHAISTSRDSESGVLTAKAPRLPTFCDLCHDDLLS